MMVGPLAWTDRRHWEFAAGPLRASRWCEGAPCRYLTRPGPHPFSVWRIIGRWSQR